MSTSKRACTGTTRKGKPCKAAPLKGRDVCYWHVAAAASTRPTPKKARVTKATVAKGRGRRPKVTDWRPVFVDALRAYGVVKYACAAAGVHRSTAYGERERNETFALAWADAETDSTERLEQEAFRRAAEGTLKPVFQGGSEVGVVREYSDTLLIFLLKARQPDRFRDNHRVEHTGADGGPIEHVTVPVDLERAGEVAAILLEAGGAGAIPAPAAPSGNGHRTNGNGNGNGSH